MKTFSLLFLFIAALGCASADPFRGEAAHPTVPLSPVYTPEGAPAGSGHPQEDALRVAAPFSPLPSLGWAVPGMVPSDPDVVALCPCGCRGWAGALDRRGPGRVLWLWKRGRWGGGG